MTELGKAIDPLVDRLLIASAVVGLYLEGRLPMWIVLVLAGRDLYLLAGAWVLARAGARRSEVIYIGKVTTALLLIGFSDLILNWPLVPGLGLVESPALPGFGSAPAALGHLVRLRGRRHVADDSGDLHGASESSAGRSTRQATPRRTGRTMKAVIMAGGEGTRLRPLTSLLPKPMVPIVNQPVMEHIIGLVKHHGINEVVATLAFMPQVIEDYFGDGDEWGMRIDYAIEETPLGTAGSVKNAAKLLPDDEPFLIISGDALTDIDLTEVIESPQGARWRGHHRAQGRRRPLEFGVVITDDDGRIERFLEKPTWGQVFSDHINTGIYVIEPWVLDEIPEGQPYDFSGELFPKLMEQGHAHLRRASSTATGATSAVARATCRCTATCSTARRWSTSRGCTRSETLWVSESATGRSGRHAGREGRHRRERHRPGRRSRRRLHGRR